MAKISFYLTDQTKKETTLFCLINYGLYSIDNGKKKYLPLKYYTDIDMHPELWNKDLNRAKESNRWANPETYDISIEAVKESAKKNYNEINDKIETFEKTAKDLIKTLSENGNVPSHDKLRNELDKVYKPSKVIDSNEPEETPKEFIPFIEFFIKTVTRKENTIKSYNTLKNNLIEYQKVNKLKLTFEKIDIDFYGIISGYILFSEF